MYGNGTFLRWEIPTEGKVHFVCVFLKSASSALFLWVVEPNDLAVLEAEVVVKIHQWSFSTQLYSEKSKAKKINIKA